MTVHTLFIEPTTLRYSAMLRESEESKDNGAFGEISMTSLHHYLDLHSVLKQQEFDALVLDLSMVPTDERTAYVCQIHERFPALPFVLIGPPEADEFALSMITCGVQQFLVEELVTYDNLQRAIRHAAARNELVQRLVSRLRAQEREKELGKLDQMAQSASSISERMMGSLPLSKTIPDVFEELIMRYEQLLDMAIEKQAYHVHYDLANAIKGMASELGRLRAGPRDVIQIHSTAIKRKLGGTPERSQAMVTESRLVMIELMGDLAQYYRTISMGVTG